MAQVEAAGQGILQIPAVIAGQRAAAETADRAAVGQAEPFHAGQAIAAVLPVKQVTELVAGTGQGETLVEVGKQLALGELGIGQPGTAVAVGPKPRQSLFYAEVGADKPARQDLQVVNAQLKQAERRAAEADTHGVEIVIDALMG
ncbi:hypothetical protein D3C75_1005620 [compost metagenome]